LLVACVACLAAAFYYAASPETVGINESLAIDNQSEDQWQEIQKIAPQSVTEYLKRE
jgi:hypothetical protein